MANAKLFSPLKIRELTLRNRIFVSPMCQYSATEGMPDTWHLVHLGSRAVGGAGLVMAEATAVSAVGRISPGDTGLWNEAQLEAWKPIAHFISDQGASPAIQLAHAGRKAGYNVPWQGGQALSPNSGGWTPDAPSAVPFDDKAPLPREMTKADIARAVDDFAAATQRAHAAGFAVVEIHMAHGYLLHEFLSPLANQRSDEFGGSLANRMRFPLQVAQAVRKEWPVIRPVFVRLSVTDWAPGGWDLEQSIVFCKELKKIGIDLIDCSSGGMIANAKIPVSVGYQVSFAAEIKRQAEILTSAVGLITNAQEAEMILQQNLADVVSLGREFLRDPYFPLHAAKALHVDWKWPKQYERAKI